MLILMSMSKRIQIPVDARDLALLKQAAARSGVSLAEWARSLLRREAREALGGGSVTPREALAALCALDAPVDDVQTMIDESIRGRLT